MNKGKNAINQLFYNHLKIKKIMKKLATFLVALCATTALWAAFTPAAFTVSADGKQVYFSQGNLQCWV